MPSIATVLLTALIVGARAELLRKGQNIGPQLLSEGPRGRQITAMQIGCVCVCTVVFPEVVMVAVSDIFLILKKTLTSLT